VTAEQRFARARPRLLRLAYSQLGDLGEAEDVVPFGEVAEVVGRTPQAVRQLASRARRHVAEQRPRFEASPDEHERAVRAFANALAEGDLEGLVAALDPDVVWTADGGGRAIASRRPIAGAARVARAWIAMRRKATLADLPRAVEVNGRLGLMFPTPDGHRSVMSFSVEGGRIVRIDVVRNPQKLRRVG
jgi:RNA polymerase sigma-70 factor, ECF subfamily